MSKNIIINSIILIINLYYVFSAPCQDNNCKTCTNYEFPYTCSECNNGFYITSINDCSICSSDCKDCTDKCNECNIGFYLTYNNLCVECSPNCESCKFAPTNNPQLSLQYCESCKINYFVNSKLIHKPILNYII